jgi:hypothetical protein
MELLDLMVCLSFSNNIFWETIKHDIIAMFAEFFSGKLDIHRLNYVVVSLIPKEDGASNIKSFGPISLINCSFKFFSKSMTNHFTLIMNDIIGINHYAFIKGGFILESVVSAHEIVHSVKQSSSSGVVLKLDYEKAFDMVDLDFPLDIIRKRGLG